jgi:hypothetical protein
MPGVTTFPQKMTRHVNYLSPSVFRIHVLGRVGAKGGSASLSLRRVSTPGRSDPGK